MASFHLVIASQYLSIKNAIKLILSCEILVEKVANKCWIIWTSPGMHVDNQGKRANKGEVQNQTPLNTHVNNFDKLKKKSEYPSKCFEISLTPTRQHPSARFS